MTDTRTPGPGVDAHGSPVIDPTANVIALTDAAVKRLDDLSASQQRRQDDLRDAEARHFREVSDLRAAYEEKLREKETQRIDAIREVDVGAVTRASEVANLQASTLANQVQASAEANRAQVAAVAAATASALSAALEPIQKSIEDLRKTQYEQQGVRAARTEGRDVNQWAVGIAITLIIVAVQVALHFMR